MDVVATDRDVHRRPQHNKNRIETKKRVVYECVVYVRFNRDLPLDISYVLLIVIDDIAVIPFPLLHFPTLLSYS